MKYVPSYLTTPVAKVLLNVSDTGFGWLVESGRLKRWGGAQARFLTGDIAKLRGRPITLADIDEANAVLAPRRALYRAVNARRPGRQMIARDIPKSA